MIENMHGFEISRMDMPPTGEVRVDMYCLYYIISGKCIITTNDVTLRLRAGDATLLQDGAAHRIEGVCSLMRIAFDRQLFYAYCLPVTTGSAILNSFFVHESDRATVSCLYFEDLPRPIENEITDMLEEYEQRLSCYESILICRLTSLLLLLSRNCKMNASVTEAPNSQLVQKMLAYMTRNFDTVTLESLAENFTYHPNSVAAKLKRETGKTFSELITQIRMGYASDLLGKTEFSVQQIAEMCGYHNMSNFYARFHAHFGMTPAEYARTIKR